MVCSFRKMEIRLAHLFTQQNMKTDHWRLFVIVEISGGGKIERRCVSLMSKKPLLVFEWVTWLRRMMDAVVVASLRGRVIEVGVLNGGSRQVVIHEMWFCSPQRNSYFYICEPKEACGP